MRGWRAHGQSVYGTRGGPIEPQSWGVSTQTPATIYLHVLDATKADADGWLTLSGSAACRRGKWAGLVPMAKSNPEKMATVCCRYDSPKMMMPSTSCSF